MSYRRVMALSLVLFFVYLSDAILSDWVPGVMETKLGGAMMMGLVMSFSSMVGIVTDVLFPQIFKRFRSSLLILLAILMAFVFAVILLVTHLFPWLAIFLLAMGVWGLYYEFLSFGSQQYLADTVPREGRSSAWAGLVGVKSVAYVFGPLIGGFFAMRAGNENVPVLSLGLLGMGLAIFGYWHHRRRDHLELIDDPSIKIRKFNLMTEMHYWMTLGGRVWPILIASLFMMLIDAFYWSIGTILSDDLGRQNYWGMFFLPFYNLPAIFVGFLMARLKIVKGKKKLATKLLGLAGVMLVLVGFANSIWILLVLSLLIGILLSASWPLLDAVYTDLAVRMGKERNHLIGLGNSTGSLAYVLGPILAGTMATFFGHQSSFSILGVAIVLVAISLLILTPKKLKLPQTKLAKWE